MSREEYLKKRVVKVLVQGEAYYARTMSGETLQEMRMLAKEEGLSGEDDVVTNVRIANLLCCRCACDEHGARKFNDDEIEFVSKEVAFDIASAVGEAAIDASGLGDNEPGKD